MYTIIQHTSVYIHIYFLYVAFSEASENVTSGSETLCEFSSTKLAIQHPEVCPVPSTVPTTMPSTVSKCTTVP